MMDGGYKSTGRYKRRRRARIALQTPIVCIYTYKYTHSIHSRTPAAAAVAVVPLLLLGSRVCLVIPLSLTLVHLQLLPLIYRYFRTYPRPTTIIVCCPAIRIGGASRGLCNRCPANLLIFYYPHSVINYCTYAYYIV